MPDEKPETKVEEEKLPVWRRVLEVLDVVLP